jgi:hypothetical protein
MIKFGFSLTEPSSGGGLLSLVGYAGRRFLYLVLHFISERGPLTPSLALHLYDGRNFFSIPLLGLNQGIASGKDRLGEQDWTQGIESSYFLNPSS